MGAPNIMWQSYYLHKVPQLVPSRVSFWWRDILRVNVEFRGIAKCLAGIGDSVGLWEDRRLFFGSPLSLKYPSLFTYVPIRVFLCRKLLLPMIYFKLSDFQCRGHPTIYFLGTTWTHLESWVCKVKSDSWFYLQNNSICSSSSFYKHHFAAITPLAPFMDLKV
jgi:hypothetical protein